ncbi:MAG: OmpH family outer membrane protein [Thiofilum sp.]|uniref:OmpH family outer membrane protein n=1 Tax=Thiofilum sp. TaxID=2212733 RepID=UPI0025E5A9E6|nr:OmpH family outer membrane protein [Thiofilum sp.]MBK8453591.1 OmpH family outer membrane protein [Thiofilum sp.]
MRLFIVTLLFLISTLLISVLNVQAESESPTPPTTKPSTLNPTTPPPKVAIMPSRTVVATVNVSLLLNRAPQSAAATEQLKQKYAPIEADLGHEQQAIQEVQDQLAQLPEDERLQKDRDLRSRQRNYERAVEDYRAELRLARDEQLSQVQKQVIDAINAVRIQNKIDIVLKENDYIAASSQVDITNQVLDYLQQQFNTQVNSSNPNPLNTNTKEP